MIRDKGLPMPAGAILLSPWVDLTHSFPSIVQDNPGDYIPPIGFRCKPSAAWPPPNSDQIHLARKEALENSEANDSAEKAIPKKNTEAETTAKKGYTVHPDGIKHDEQSNPGRPENGKEPERREANTVFVDLDGEHVEVKDQIHMYTTNNLLSHPLVSPALQPSLGGLPPLQILTGGGEMLRDEQIYVAHKAANPTAYPPSDAYLDEYDPTSEILNKYPPTDVQLQVWDDLCHVAPALSFTRPAKYMFRSIAQFGSWALPRNQNEANISGLQDPATPPAELPIRQLSTNGTDNTSGPQKSVGSVGKAGDPLPAFQDHMIRQRVDKRGRIYPLDPPHTFAALQMSPSQVGTFNPALVKKWLAGKQEWDEKFAKEKLHFQSRRIKELYHEFQNADGESPPPSALAARKAAPGVLPTSDEKKNYLMLMWNHWATKHDKKIIGREQHDEQATGRHVRTSIDGGTIPSMETPVNEGLQPDTTERSSRKPQTGNDTAFNGPKGIRIDAGTANQEIAESRTKKSTGDLSTTSDLPSNYQPASPRTYKSSYDRPMSSPLLVLPDYDDKKHTDENASTKALFHAAGTLPVSVSETSLSRPSRSYRPGSRADSMAGFTEDANSTVADDKSLAVTTVGADNASTRAVLHSTGVVDLVNDGASAGLGGSTRQSVDALSTSHRAPSDIDIVSSMGDDAENGERTSMAKERPHMPEREVFQTADEFQ